jgi:hypothetical protein
LDIIIYGDEKEMQATIKKVTKVETFDEEYGEIVFYRFSMVGEDGNTFIIKTDENDWKVGQTLTIE